MLRVLVKKLELQACLDAEDKRALLDLEGEIRQFGSRQDILIENERSDYVGFFLRGYGLRYKLIGDDRRQITACLLPGDCCEQDIALAPVLDHSIAALSPATLVFFPRRSLLDLLAAHSAIERALRWGALVDRGISREWVVNLGQRTAGERLAHLMCEIYARLEMLGLAQNGTCDFPLTQAELADTLGLSTVHVNRTLQDLRRANLITLKGRKLIVHDLAALRQMAIFDPAYLCQGDPGCLAARALSGPAEAETRRRSGKPAD